jgi:hypothetical protein
MNEDDDSLYDSAEKNCALADLSATRKELAALRELCREYLDLTLRHPWNQDMSKGWTAKKDLEIKLYEAIK